MNVKCLLILALPLMTCPVFAAKKLSHPTCLLHSAVMPANGASKVLTESLEFEVNEVLSEKGWKVIETTSSELIARVTMINSDNRFIDNGDEVHFYMEANLGLPWNGYVKFTMNRYTNEKPVMRTLAYQNIGFTGSSLSIDGLASPMSGEKKLRKALRKSNLRKLIPECVEGN